MVDKQTLESWKEIAAYLKRSVKTCQRLEHEQGLPVHRLEDSPRARVFAYKQEIDRWIETTQHSEQKSFFGKLGLKRFLIPAFIGIGIVIIAVVVWKLVPRAQVPSDSIGESTASAGPSYMQVTYSGIAGEPAISPDGSSVAYVAKEPGQDAKLMLRDLSGGEAIEPLRQYWIMGPRWSPDGSELFVCTTTEDGREADCWLVSRLEKTARPVPFGPFIRYCLSPDGTQIASVNRMTNQISVTNKSTGDGKGFVVRSNRVLDDIDWARKSGLILVSGLLNNGRNAILTIQPYSDKWLKVVKGEEIELPGGLKWPLRIAAIDDSQLHKVVEEESEIDSPRWSGTGDAIYYLRTKDQRRELVKIPIDAKSGMASGSPTVLSRDTDIQGRFTLSADNTRLAFTRGVSYSNLWLAEFMDRKNDQRPQIKPLTAGAAQRINPSISPNGKWIAFAGSGNIYKIPIEGGPQTQLTFSDSIEDSPVWSPDGKWIACGSSKGEARNILLIDADAGSSTQLTASTKKLYGPVWSPDGKQIAYGSYEDGDSRVWIVDISGGNPKQLAVIQWSESHFLSWSPGRNILYQTSWNRGFVILDPETGEQKPLIRNPVGFPNYPVLSPDRKKVVASWFRLGTDASWTGGLLTTSLSDNTETHLTSETLKAVGWSPDGSMVYAIAPPNMLRNDSLLAFLAAGGDPQTLFTLPGSITEVSISPDGKKFVCTMSESKSDVWIMENFDPDQK